MTGMTGPVRKKDVTEPSENYLYRGFGKRIRRQVLPYVRGEFKRGDT